MPTLSPRAIDPVVYFLPTLGVGSGEVLWPCSAATDCSLNGKCDAGGACACNAGWVGRRCQQLHLADVNRKALGFSPQTSDGKNMSSWGGSVQQVKGKWHMYAVEMLNHCGISSYLMNSGVVHAVADRYIIRIAAPAVYLSHRCLQQDRCSLLFLTCTRRRRVGGPYSRVAAVLAPFTHEPDVVRAPTGELVMATVHGLLSNTSGWDGKPYHSCDCSASKPPTLPGATTRSCVTCNNSCLPDAAPTLSVATDPGGPWKSTGLFPAHMHRHGENPSIWITKSGEIYGMSRGGDMALYGSDWRNSSTFVAGTKSGKKATLSSFPDAEDPFIYQDEDNHWHALLHSLEGPHMVISRSSSLIS